MPSNYSIARDLIADGYVVGPGSTSSKKPLGKWKHGDATITCRTEAEARAQWKKHPRAVPLIFCKMSGIVVVDVDPRNGGEIPEGLPETFTVRTPGGGWHFYYEQADKAVRYPGQLARGVDLKWDGYVLGYGSAGYEIERDVDLAPAPAMLLERARPEKASVGGDAAALRAGLEAQVDRTLIEILDRVETFELSNDSYFRVLAATVEAYAGTSLYEEALDALQAWNDSWAEANGRDAWSAREAHDARVQALEDEARMTHPNPAGVGSAIVLLDPDGSVRSAIKRDAREERQNDKAEEYASAEVKPFDIFAKVQPREWVLGTVAMCGVYSVIAAQGGVGKTTLSMAMALAVATGKPLVGEQHKPHHAAPVLLWSSEDGENDARERLQACAAAHGITEAPNLYCEFGDQVNMTLVSYDEKGVATENTALVDALIQKVKDRKVEMVIMDPLVGLHAVNENSNDDMKVVAMSVRRVAREANAAVVLIHHVTKSANASSGDATASRGAGVITDHARIVHTMVTMDEKLAEQREIHNRFEYVALVDAKGNFNARSSKYCWYRHTPVEIDNGGVDSRGNQREARPVSVLRWQKSLVDAGTELDRWGLIISTINRTPEDRLRESGQAKSWAGYVIAEALGEAIGEPGQKLGELSEDQRAARVRLDMYLKDMVDLRLLKVGTTRGGDRHSVKIYEAATNAEDTLRQWRKEGK